MSRTTDVDGRQQGFGAKEEMSKGQTGASTGSVEWSKDALKRVRKAKMRQTARWNRKNGPVTTRFVCPVCGGPHSKTDHGVQETTSVPSPPSPKRKRRGRGVPQEWTAAEQAIIDDASGKRAA